MPQSKLREALKEQAQARIAELAASPADSALQVLESAQAVHALAVRADSRLLEAEALMLYGRTLLPTPEPRRTLAALEQARQIFIANGLPGRAAASQIGAALVRYELGQERQAIHELQSALAEPLLAPDDRVAAAYVAVLAHGHLGELDIALQLLADHALPLARSASRPGLLARVLWARARTWWLVLVHHRHPALWRGLPTGEGRSQVNEPAPTPAFVQALIQQARDAMPGGQRCGYIDLLQHVVQGLFGAPQEVVSALAELAGMRQALQRDDPPLAAWAALAQAMVLLQRPEPQAALDAILWAQAEAAPRDWLCMLRDLLLYEAGAREALGDHRGALLAYKRYAELRLNSFTLLTPQASIAGRPWPAPVPAPVEAGDSVPGALLPPLRNLEPAHVRQALRFIEAGLRGPMDVGAVVAHSQVGRRTLEVAFKASKGCTIAEYIKRRRLELATVALARTDQSVQQVAAGLGFGSAAAFSRDFLAHYGMPPSVWRRLAPGG